MSSSQPGDKNFVCLCRRKTSPHAHICRDCRREFYLHCIAIKTPTEGQKITCPNCGRGNLQHQSPS